MSVEALARFSIVVTIHVTPDASPRKSLENLFKGFDYRTFHDLKKSHKGTELYPLIRSIFYTRFMVDHYLFKTTIPRQMPTIKAAFIHPSNIFGITFLHGTQIGTLITLLKDDWTLMPGEKARRRFCLHGEHNNGFSGVSRRHISGNQLADAAFALNYAMHCGSDFNPQALIATRHPRRGLETLLEDLGRYGRLLSDKVKLEEFWNEHFGYDAPPHRIYNIQRCFTIIRALNREAFDLQVKPLLEGLIFSLAERSDLYSKDLRTRLFEPILSIKIPTFSSKEIDLIKLDIPIVFGSNTVKVAQSEKENCAYPIFFSKFRECAFKGSLRLGDDIQFVFTHSRRIVVVKDYLRKLHISLPVLDMDALLIASSFLQYRHEKLSKETINF